MQFNAVIETNTPAIRFWRSFGFQILATVREAFRQRVDVVLSFASARLPQLR
jgi:ribosomal protein S18 acetylase RimI-like enzyme